METTNPYQSPEAEVTEFDNSAKVQKPKFGAMRGRIGRMRYFCYTVVWYIYITFMIEVISTFGNYIPMPKDELEAIVTVIGMLILMPFMIILAIRRGHDLGLKGTYAVLAIIPIVNLFYGLYLTFAAGSGVENAYGLPPSENTFGLKFGFGVIMTLCVAIIFFAVVAVMNA